VITEIEFAGVPKNCLLIGRGLRIDMLLESESDIDLITTFREAMSSGRVRLKIIKDDDDPDA